MRLVILVFIALAAIPVSASTQQLAKLQQGAAAQHGRATVNSPAPIADSLDQSHARDHLHGALKGALIGTGVGVVTGALIGAFTYHKRGSPETQGLLGCYFDCSPGASALGGAIVGGGAGLVLGAVIGGIRGTKH